MNRFRILMVIVFLCLPNASFALSRAIDRDIEFPKDYDPVKAQAIRKIIRDEQFTFAGGIVSYWPPDWGTRLSFSGDVISLNTFFEKLRTLNGIGLRVLLYNGRDDEERRDSDWQLDYSHARPNELTVCLNLKSKQVDFAELKLPEWQAITD